MARDRLPGQHGDRHQAVYLRRRDGASRDALSGQYAAANLDPDRFERPLDFDPRLERDVEHVAFGEGAHRCQGEVGAEQFVEDVLGEILRALPRTAFLDGGTLLRETGISMSVPRLPVNPR